MADALDKPALPLFYKSIRALDRAQDGELKISSKPDFSFTANSNAIPLVTDEFPYAGADYPIVFAPGTTPVPVAVVGLELDKNLMLAADGKNWRDRCYVPAYIRRYPFILVEDPDTKQLVLCLEEDAAQFSTAADLPLFEDDKPADFTKRTLDFCMALRQQGDVTEGFVRALNDRQLLQPGSVTVTLPNSGRNITMDGFLAVDVKRFQALPASIIADWHRREWMGLIYAHLQSSLRWQKLAEIVESG